MFQKTGKPPFVIDSPSPMFFFWSSKRLCREESDIKDWLAQTETKISNLSLRRGQRALARQFSLKIRGIHRRFSFFYLPYRKQFSRFDRSGGDSYTSAAPETLLLATRWILKKHASIAAEFRSLETTSARISFDEVSPVNMLRLTRLLDDYAEETAFRFSEETLANTLNDWQESTGISLSLSETEAVSLILRLLALDKLSAVALRLATAEKARASARKYFDAFGPNARGYESLLKKIQKNEGGEYADIFSDTVGQCREEFSPLSRLQETPPERGSRRQANETKVIHDLASRTRTILRALPLLGEFEWNTILRKTNLLHKLLIRDPSGIYAEMSSLSQEMYRKKTASLAKSLRLPEETIVRTALALSEEHSESPEIHVGFYLLDDGLPKLLRRLTGSSRMSWWHWYHDRSRLPFIRAAYLFLVFFVSLFAAVLFAVFYLRYRFLIVIAFPIFYKTAKHLVDSLFSSVVPPTFLPRLNFRRRIPESASAVFVIPALLKDRDTLSSLIGKLETAYLSNSKSSLSYYLLLDYVDAEKEHLEKDDVLFQEAKSAFRNFNERYAETDRFAFVLRSRVWSERQGRWMGWERKRGKLLDFAKMLRGRTPSSPFFLSATSLPKADFIITLDEDAFIPRDFIKEMLGIHAHPLQKPILDENGRRLRGYTFVQPHVKQWFKNRHRFRLPRIFFDEKRFSAYSSIFPEIYQDVFSEGSYAGKGSIHVDAFLSALDGTLPENQILSHDLLEGSLARTAYAADIDVFDEFPKSLRAMLARNHRWTRGDWQIIDWLAPTVRDEQGNSRPNTLLGVHRFKIADNLLQSLFRPAVFLITVLSWIVENPHLLIFVWGVFLLDLFILDIGIDWLRWIFQLFFGPWRHLAYRFRRTAVRSFRLFRQAAFECVTLPYAALDTTHAIITALYRRFWSKRNMLEWIPSAHFENPAGRIPLLFPLVTVLIAAINIHLEKTIQPVFAFLLVIWTGIPLLVFALNRPYGQRRTFSRHEEDRLRQDALETWNFFAETVSPKTNFLPPDYLRSGLAPKTAEYTSITNIGFFLVSTIVAHRLGFISFKRAAEYLENTCATLERMPRHQGHFYNWYETKTALPAPPSFISSVDSGNLLASLIVLRQWLIRRTAAVHIPSVASGLLTLADYIRSHTPRAIDAQAFADFWSTLSERVRDLSIENEPEFFIQCRAIETSLVGITLPKSLPSEVPGVFSLFKEQIRDTIESGQTKNHLPGELFDPLRKKIDTIIADMRFDFLRSKKRSLLSIGLNLPTKRLENRFYQTLASEARIANFLALAEGTLSFRGWNKLNRTVIPLPKGPSLISWTGTLFEYLMPAIFLEEHRDSLVGKSLRTAILMNIRFAKKKKIPVWGLSESAYAELDRGGNFRYKPFGLPSLSLSPSADDRPVISAYSIALSLSVLPRLALKNLDAYAVSGGRGVYGYVESIDFQRSRHGSPVNMFMSHHQGMILASIGNCLASKFLNRLFESHPLVQNSLFVLDEGIPPIDKEPFPRPATPYLQSALAHPRTP